MAGFSIVTSFSKRIYESPYQDIFDCMQVMYPHVPFYVYHENSHEMRKHGRKIEFKDAWDGLVLADLFEVQPDMEPFIYGQGNPFDNAEGYWNTNARFWVRKVFAIQHCARVCETDYMIWADADVKFFREKPLDDDFWGWLSRYDIAFLKRDGIPSASMVETGFICFRLTPRVKVFINDYLDYFLSGAFLSQARWDDSCGFTVVAQRPENRDLKQGYFSNRELGAPSPDNSPFSIHDYVSHHKGPLVSVRSKE